MSKTRTAVRLVMSAAWAKQPLLNSTPKSPESDGCPSGYSVRTGRTLLRNVCPERGEQMSKIPDGRRSGYGVRVREDYTLHGLKFKNRRVGLWIGFFRSD
ncbi:MAG: hypothetical protein WC721_00120 [Victivallaceae bacterium]